MAVTRIGLSGLSTDVNPRKAQPGAMEVATNVVCRSEDVIEPRPGLYQSAQYTGIGDAQRVVHYDGAVTTIDDSGVEAFGIGDIVDRDAASITGFNGYCDATEARGNLYIASQKGLQKVTSGSVTLSDWAGLPHLAEVVSPTLLNSSISAENWLANGSGVAYRALVRREDANGVIVRSSPSSFGFISNSTGGARAVDVTVYLHTGKSLLRAGDVVELYRTVTVTTSTPPAQFFLLAEIEVSAAHLSAEQIDYTDTAVQSTLGEALYSNSGQEGREYSAPQHGKVLSAFAGSVFVSNVTSPQNKFVRFNTKQGTQNSVSVDVDVNGTTTVTLNAETALITGATLQEGMYLYHATYFPTGSQILDITGSTLTMSVAASGSSTFVVMNAFDVLEVTDGTTTEVHTSFLIVYEVAAPSYSLPYTSVITQGSDLISARWLTPSIVTGSKDYSCYLEALPGVTATLQIKGTNAAVLYGEGIPEYASGFGDFDQDVEPALSEWSNVGQPESFIRGVNQAFIGNLGKAIWAAIPFASRHFYFKEDGIYVMDGGSERAGFRVEELSPLHVIMSPRHACAGVDAAYAWTTEGVIALGASGAITNVSNQVVSRKLRPFVASEAGLLGGMWFADNEVHLVARQTLEDVTQSVYLVYNTETKQWTEWTINGTAVGGCAPGASLYGHLSRFAVLTSDGGDVHLWQAPTRITVSGNEAPPEYYAADLITGTTTVTATPAAAGTNLYSFTASFSSFGIVPGIGDMLISPAQAWKGVITAVTNNGGGSYTMTFYSRDTVTASSATIQALYGFSVELKLVPIASQDPLAWRHWMAAHWEILGPMSLYTVRVGTESTSGYAGSEPIVYQRARNFPTYTDPGDGAPYQLGFKPRYLFSRKHAHAASVQPTLTIDEGGAIWRLSAISLEESRGSHKTHRNTA